jgi:3-deoxy-D-manno-octulosonic-acid transferase
MRRPLALKLYLALNSGQSSRDPQWTPSTDGDYKHIPVVWFHCEQAQDLSIVQALALRLLETRDDIKVVITTADIGEAGVQSPLALEVVPSENHRDVQAFLDHWSPDVGLWYGSNLRPALLDAA